MRRLAIGLAGAYLLALASVGLAQYGTNAVGPGTALNASVYAAIYPYGVAPVAFATLPTCTAVNVGAHAFINNSAATPTWAAAAPGTPATTFIPVVCAPQTGATFAWVNG